MLKSVELGRRTATNHFGPNELHADQCVQEISFFGEKQVFVAMKNGEAKVFETEKAEFSAPKKLLDDGQEWAGLGILEDAIVGATDNAVVKVWERKEFEEKEDFEEIAKIESKTEQTIKSAGKVRAGKVRRKTMVIGGESTQLQMVDLENLDKGVVWSAKNVRPDKLQLHIPINFPAIALPEKTETIACTSYGSLTNQAHELRIYDPRQVQRRPVKRIEWETYPITSLLSMDDDGQKYVVGTARGRIALFDIRYEKKFLSFKGAAGSIRSIAQHPDKENIFCAVGLDRFLHIYDAKIRKKLHKVYLKSPLNRVLIEKGAKIEKDTEEEKEEEEEIEAKVETWNEMDNLESVQD